MRTFALLCLALLCLSHLGPASALLGNGLRNRLLRGSGSMGSTGFMGSYALYAGSVTLVGAGPGDPELLTLQAFKLLKSAELVVADRLVSREILDLIDCELRVANKKPGCAEEAQEEINQWVVKAALEGKRVIRLKIGDPFLFGRGGEEVIEYRKSGIEAQVVPGISSAYSAPLAAMVPITHRGVANEVVICTGFGREGTTVDAPEYRPDRTVVLLMAVGRIGKIAEEMVGRWGYPADTPVSIIEQATTPRQRVLRGTLEDIGEVALQQGAKAPATIVVGNVNNVL
ncbi:tetrapyrrole methylase [Ochromonadaceae sp. CCMP2298]|nr:tetrapyrrole methylase [Ochromonadaceae sp. CCMP2298]